MVKCPHCNENFMLTIEELAKEVEETYPQSVFKTHPIAWVRRLLKFISGMDYHVLVSEEEFTKWKGGCE